MGFRVRKSFKIAPGVRMTVSPKSIGVSAGVRGARVSVNSRRGTTTTVGIPGSGISYSARSKATRSGSRATAKSAAPAAAKRPSAPPAVSSIKPGVFAPGWEKSLHKAVSGTVDVAALRKFATETPVAAGVLSLAEVLFVAYPAGDLARTRALLEWMHDTGYRPEDDAPATKYLAGETLTISIAHGITAEIPVDSSAIALLLAELEQELGNLPRATAIIEGSEPTTLAAVSLAELYADQGRWVDIVELTNGLTNEDEPSTYLLIQRGVAFRELTYYEASREALKESLRVRSRPTTLRNLALIERGKSHLAENKRSLARKDFERVMADDSRFAGLDELIDLASA